MTSIQAGVAPHGSWLSTPFQNFVAATMSVFAFGTAIGVAMYGLGASPEIRRGAVERLGLWEILSTNVGVVMTMAVGVFTLGLVSVTVLFVNGVVLGVAVTSFAAAGDAHLLLTGLAPHFVPEVAAFVVAAAADLRLTGALIQWIRKGERPAWSSVLRAWGVPHVLAILLLVAAAIIEAYVSSI